jgi:hypothetical protein
MNAMEAKEFDVEIVYRQRAVYRVRAKDRESAERLGAAAWQNGEESGLAGYDWSEIQSVHVSDEVDPQRSHLDTQVVLRFIREREQLILRLGGDGSGPSPNDAISAAQVAADLGWTRPGQESPQADVSRAARALERLCSDRVLICFRRQRVRAGERGEIRLYCTSEYLDQLSAELHVDEPRPT